MSANRGTDAFDLDFRPASYFVHRDPAPGLLQNIKGDLRREMARDALQTGRDIDPRFYDEGAPEAFRDQMERVDPRWMGGEYLPEYEDGEVEIARLVLASVTQDVYSVRARWVANALRYRIVDEYETDWYLTRETSERPLSMRELIELIDHATFSDNQWDDLTDALRDGTCGDDGDPAHAADFVAVSSELYPQLERYYAAKAAAWLVRHGGARTRSPGAASPDRLNLPLDTPMWVRQTLEQMAAEGKLLSEAELRPIFLSQDQPLRVMNQDYEDYLASLTGNPANARPDIEPEIEDEGIPLSGPPSVVPYGRPGPPRAPDAPVEVFHGERPKRRVHELGEITSLEGDDPTAMHAVLEAARKLGADGVIVLGHYAIDATTSETTRRPYGVRAVAFRYPTNALR